MNNRGSVAFFALLCTAMLFSMVQYAGAAPLAANIIWHTQVDVGQNYAMSFNVFGGAAPYTANWVWSNSILGITISTPMQTVSSVSGYNTVSLNINPMFPGMLVNTYNGVAYALPTPVAPPNSVVGNWVLSAFVSDSGGNVIEESNVLGITPALLVNAISTTTNARGCAGYCARCTGDSCRPATATAAGLRRKQAYDRIGWHVSYRGVASYGIDGIAA